MVDFQRKEMTKTKRGAPKPFDFSKYSKQHVALKVAYLGFDYDGFAVQETSQRTIEAKLFEAFLKTRLIESRETSNYHRCGRTDKGVSAYGQVISLDLRSSSSSTATLPNSTATIDYPKVLNAVLPPEIRVLAWAPVPPEFSARFKCRQRTYKYYFPKGNLDVEAMNEACSLLIGEHDFRNFCKLDVCNGVLHCRRNILDANVRPVCEEGQALSVLNSPYQMYELTISGKAFLWHQVRCCCAVLFSIGEHRETPKVIKDLLDVEACPSRPQYTMAADFPLNLYDCAFDDLQWIVDQATQETVIKHFQKTWTEYSVRATMLRQMLCQLEADSQTQVMAQTCALVPENTSRVYCPIMFRPRSDPIDVKLLKSAKKQKLSEPQAESIND